MVAASKSKSKKRNTSQGNGKTSHANGVKTSGSAKRTTKPEVIRKWAEARKGKPATVKGTGGKNQPGLLRIDFPGYRGKDTLQEISWDQFFAKFEENNLAFVYQDRTATGKVSRFCKLVSRDTPRSR